MKQLIIGIAILPLFLQSCKEVIATDISENMPTLILPQYFDTIQENPVHFKWEEMSGATEYHLQIVSPDFSNIQEYVVDSLVEGTDIYLSLDSNKFEMKLTAMNEGYSSLTLGPIDFTVGTNSNSSNNLVVLSSPAAGVYFNEGDFPLEFSWQAISNLESFEYSLRNGTSYASPDVRYTLPGIVSTQLDLPVSVELEEGQYFWGVKAYLTDGNQTVVTSRNFYVDTTSPVAPTPVSPAALESPGTVNFTWTNAIDPGNFRSPVTIIIEVAQDPGFTVFPDSQELQSGTSTTFNLTGTGNRYWRMKCIDGAGNESPYSATTQFTLN